MMSLGRGREKGGVAVLDVNPTAVGILDSLGEVNSVRFQLVTPYALTAALRAFLAGGGTHVVHFLAADPVVQAGRDPAYRELLNQGDVNISDGMGLVWAL